MFDADAVTKKNPFERIRMLEKIALPFEVTAEVDPENSPFPGRRIETAYGPLIVSSEVPVESYTPTVIVNTSVLNSG